MKIDKEIIDAIFKHGEKEAPLEACGYLAGKEGNVLKYYPITNADKSETHFSFAPEEQFKVIKNARAENMELIAVYHTHPASPARPSGEDIKLAYDPNIIYVIASLSDVEKSIKAFKIVKGKVTEEELIKR